MLSKAIWRSHFHPKSASRCWQGKVEESAHLCWREVARRVICVEWVALLRPVRQDLDNAATHQSADFCARVARATDGLSITRLRSDRLPYCAHRPPSTRPCSYVSPDPRTPCSRRSTCLHRRACSVPIHSDWPRRRRPATAPCLAAGFRRWRIELAAAARSARGEGARAGVVRFLAAA